MFCAAHVFGVHVGAPHWLGVPPQPSPAGPHWTPCDTHVTVLQTGGLSGTTHELRSKIMNSSSFSCALMAPAAHSAGKIIPFESPTFSTWKSSKSTRPHCCAGGE